MITSGRDPDPEKIRIPVASGVARHAAGNVGCARRSAVERS